MCQDPSLHRRPDLSQEILKAAAGDLKYLLEHEKILFLRMSSIYKLAAKKAIASAVGRAASGGNAKSVDKAVRAHMLRAFSKEDLAKISRDISRFYVVDKIRSAKKFKLKPILLKDPVTLKAKKPSPKIGAGFDLDDKAVVQALQAQNAFAASNLYSKGLSAAVTDAIAQTLEEDGLSRTAAAEKLREQLEKSLGLTPNEIRGTIAPSFHGTADDYFSGLSTTTINRAQNFNRVLLFKQAGVETYRISAILDNRTSEICIAMDGRVFTIEQAEKNMNDILAAESSDDLKEIAPWQRNLEDLGAKTPDAFKEGPKAVSFSSKLADAGMALPPYHFRCRTQVVLIS